MNRSCVSSVRFGLLGSEDGSTFIEVLAAVAILSVVAAVLWFATDSARSGLRSAVETRGAVAAALRFRESVLRYAERIQPSYWADELAVEQSDGGMRIHHLDGDREGWLHLETADGIVITTSSGEIDAFPRVRAGVIEVLESGGISYGLSIAIADLGEELTIAAPFGATVVRAGEREGL